MYSHKPALMVLAAALGFGSYASAGVVTKMNVTRSRVIVAGPELQAARVGDRLIINSQCELRVTTVATGKVAADTTNCMDRRALRLGASTILAKNDFQQSAAEQEVIHAENEEIAAAQMNAAVAPSAKLPSSYIAKGFAVGLGAANISKKSVVKQMAYQYGYQTTAMPYKKVNDGSSTKPELNMNYSWIPRNGFGFMGDVSVSQVDGIITKDAYNFIRPSVNVAFGAPSLFYGYAGVNYMFFLQEPTESDNMFDGQSYKLKPDPGFQAGAGLVAWKNFQVNVQYSWARINISEEMKAAGLFSNGYSMKTDGYYELSGVEAILQYRF